MAGSPTSMDEAFTLSVHEGSIKGGFRLIVNSSFSLPDGDLYLQLRGDQQSHRVSAERRNSTCLYATLPSHDCAEAVELSLCMTDNTNSPQMLFKTQFAYVEDEKKFMAQLLLQSVTASGSPLQYTLLPPLPTPEALREYDRALATCMETIPLPPKWSLLGSDPKNFTRRETLLHFAAKHGFNSLTQHLLSLPGSSEAVLIRNEEDKLPIDIAKEEKNDGLTQLLAMYMNQVHSNGVSVDSNSWPAEKQGLGRKLSKQGLEKFKEINSEWKNQVKKSKALSYGCLPLRSPGSMIVCSQFSPSTNGAHTPPAPPSSGHHNCLHHVPMQRRHSSVAVMDCVSSRGSLQFHPGTPMDTVIINTKDTSLAEMDRQRKTSWSKVVGSCDHRSMGTGLNELDRICAEETIHEKLVEVKMEMAELESSKQDPAHSKHPLGLHQSHLWLMYRLSSSCPSLADEDGEESDAISAFLSASSRPRQTNHSVSISEEDSITDTVSPSSLISLQEWQHESSSEPQESTRSDRPSIPVVVTTEYQENASNHPITRNVASESKFMSNSKEITETRQESFRATEMRPRSALVMSDTPYKDSITRSQLSRKEEAMSQFPIVEDSIFEHRQLTQVVSSPVSSDQTEVNSTDDDYILVSSNVSLDTASDREMGSSTSVTITANDDISTSNAPPPSGTSHMSSQAPTSLRSSVSFKSHRRSLSSSEIERMRVSFPEQKVQEAASSSSQGWHSSLLIIDKIDEVVTQSPPTTSRKLVESDKRPRANSWLASDTYSMHESDTSEEEPGYHSPKEVSSEVSILHQLSDDTGTITDSNRPPSSGTEHSLEDTVVLRERSNKMNKKSLKSYRYSADCIISGFDDYSIERTEDKVEGNISSPLFRGATNTDVDVPEDNKRPPQQLEASEPNQSRSPLITKSDGSIFTYTSDASPSDVHISIASDSNLDAQNSLFYKPTGSPKTIKRRKGKIPLIPKRKTISHLEREQSPSRPRSKGLTKEDVGPTINALKGLLKDQQVDDSTPTGEPEIHFSSDVSESNSPKDHRKPIATPPPNDGGDEFSSLDFPVSPLLQQKFALSQNTMTTSPLANERNRSSSSPNADLEGSTGLSARDVETEECKCLESVSKVTGTDNPATGSNKRYHHLQTAASVDESSLYRGKLQSCMSVDHATERSQVVSQSTRLTNVLEELVNSREKGENTKSKMKQFRNNIFSSKKKQGKDRASSDTEQMGEIPPLLPPKPSLSNPLSSQYEEVSITDLKFVPAEEYNQQFLDRSASSGIHRSASLQVGVNHVGTGSHVHSSISLQSQNLTNDQEPKQQSEDTPASTSTQKPELSTLQEIPIPSDSSQDNLLSASSQIRPPSGDSENEETAHEDDQIVRSLSVTHPVLEIQEEPSWDKTVDRRIYKKMNKPERERQAILHEFLYTEKNHFRALHILKLVFRQQITKIVSEETQSQLFPQVDNLIDISDRFLKRLESKKSSKKDIIINDLSDALLEQFTGDNYDQMLYSFGVFCSGQLNATEIYKEHMKKKQFARLMKQLYGLKECQRLTLPDYYLQVSQRLSKLLTLMKRLAKKSDSLKLDHAPRVYEGLRSLDELITAVDQTVLDNKNRMEVEAIQSRLEVSVPRSTKIKYRREIKSLNLTAQNRKLRMRGMALWIGHAKEVSVHLILVTDLVVLLTERDQKYHLASLQDLKPPVIRLYDLHVRLNVSVKSGVQLLLLEKGDFPEMFRLEFVSKKQAKQWEAELSQAIDQCKEKGLKCEYFGEEKVISGDEEKKFEEKGDSDLEEAVNDFTNPALKRMQRARESLAVASKLLNTNRSSTDMSRHHGPAVPTSTGTGGGIMSTRPFLQDSPKSRNRATVGSHQPRPKTTFFNDDDVLSSSSATMHADHVISAPVSKQLISAKIKKKLDRSSTFKNKDKEKDKDKNLAPGGNGAENDGGYRVPEQQYIQCITFLKDSLQEMMNENEEKTNDIENLKMEVETLQEALQNQVSQPKAPSPVVQRSSPHTSLSQLRPYSIHVDISGSERLRDISGKGPELVQSVSRPLTPTGSLPAAEVRQHFD